VTDPLGSGFVQSLRRLGGSVTGFSLFEGSVGGKWLALLKETAPAVSEFGWIDDRNSRIAIRWSAGELERMHRFAKELVALARDGSHAQAVKGFSPRSSRFEGRLAQINSALAFYNQPLEHHAPLLVKSTEITPPTSGGGH
jgi:hypothetical protein